MKKIFECDVEAVIFGREVSGAGVRHFQGALQLRRVMRHSTVTKLFGGKVHVEPMQGTWEQSVEYCSKEDKDPFQEGCPTCSVEAKRKAGKQGGEAGGKLEQERWQTAWDLAKTGKVSEIADYHILVSQYRNLLAISKDHQATGKERRKGPIGTFLYGVPGSGKSHVARSLYHEFGEQYYKLTNKWWDGYQGERVILIEDIEPSEMVFMAGKLKIWMDIYDFPAEVKNGRVNVSLDKVVITSNYSIDELFAALPPVEKAAFRRRCEHVKFFPYKYRPDKTRVMYDVPDDMTVYEDKTPDQPRFNAKERVEIVRLPTPKKLRLDDEE